MLTKKENSKNEPKKTARNSSSSHKEEHSGCCQPPVKAMNQQPVAASQSSKDSAGKGAEIKRGSKTRITIKYDAGFPNQIYIRGKGANLSWEKGQPLKNIKADEWLWETDAHFTQCEFKVLINDRVYENGDNHSLNEGSSIVHTPIFIDINRSGGTQ